MKKLSAATAGVAALVASGVASAQTTPTTYDGSQVFSLVDLSAFSTNVQGIVAVAVGIAVLFVGFKVLKRGIGKI